MNDVPIAPSGIAALLVALALLTIAVFYAMLFLFSVAIGWRRLAREYPSHAPLPLERYRSEGAVVGEYGWTAPPLLIAIDDASLVLIPRIPFRPTFGVVSIPWSEIVSTEQRRLQFFAVFRLTLAHGGKGHRPMLLGILPTPATRTIEAHIASSRLRN